MRKYPHEYSIVSILSFTRVLPRRIKIFLLSNEISGEEKGSTMKGKGSVILVSISVLRSHT